MANAVIHMYIPKKKGMHMHVKKQYMHMQKPVKKILHAHKCMDACMCNCAYLLHGILILGRLTV